MERDELVGWLRLTLSPGVGNSACRRLLAAFGLPDAIFSQSEAALSQVVTPAQIQALAFGGVKTFVPRPFEARHIGEIRQLCRMRIGR